MVVRVIAQENLVMKVAPLFALVFEGSEEKGQTGLFRGVVVAMTIQGLVGEEDGQLEWRVSCEGLRFLSARMSGMSLIKML